MYDLLFFLFFIFSSPTLSAIFAASIVGIIAIVILRSISKERALRAKQEQTAREMRERQEARHSLVMQRYSPEIAQRILAGEIWQGMTSEQLADSLGNAEAIDTTVTKKKQKEVWKYHQETATRFGLRVTLEDGVVVGWTHR